MLILITTHKKVIFEKIYLSNTLYRTSRHKVKNIVLSLLLWKYMSRYFLITFFMYERPIPVQTKVQYKNLQLLAVTNDMGFLSCDFKVV